MTRKLLWLTAGFGGLALVAASVWMSRPPRFQLETLQLPLRPVTLPSELERSLDLPTRAGALEGANLLLVTLDTTRADRIGIYGNGDIETPHLDSLARDGVAFSRAFAVGSTTLPTHSSILTGLYPHRHGARGNGAFALGPEPVTLAEALGSAGYSTAAFISSFILDRRFGLARGFELYDDEMGRETDQPLAVLGEHRLRDPERRAEETTRRALAWLEAQTGRPFFLWVHYYDPHAEHTPPSPYAERYRGNAYDGEIAYVDAQLGRLLTALETSGKEDRTLVTVIADHGESLGDHGEATHGYLLYDATLRVPLLLRGPGGLNGGVHVTRPVSQVDLMPTWLSLLGVSAPDGLDGADLTQPRSEERTLFAETLQGQLEFGWALLRAALRGDAKLIDAPVPELYDLARDPGERLNLHETAFELAASLEASLAASYANDPEIAVPALQLDPDETARLEALGYGIGDARSERTAGVRPNPVEMVPVLLQVHAIGIEAGSGLAHDDAIAALEEIVHEHPDFVPASLMLAQLHREQGNPDAAATVLRRAAVASGDATRVVIRLADTLIDSGHEEEAISHLRTLVERRPRSFEAQLKLGTALVKSANYRGALPHLRAAYKLDPDDDRAQRLFAEALQRTGRHRRAEKVLRGEALLRNGPAG